MKLRVPNQVLFWIERLLLRGMRYRLLLVVIVIAALSLVAGLVVWVLEPSIGNPAEAVWWAFLRITDTGYLGDDTGRVRRSVSAFLTIAGAVIFIGALVAVMSQGLNQILGQLEAGTTPLRARHHIAILGWTNRTPQLLAELLQSEGRVRRFLERRGARRLRIVILAEEVTRELHHTLRERLGSLWSERTITFRSGSPLKIEHLRRVDVEHAAAFVIPGSDFAPAGPERVDANAVKTLLTIARHGGDDPSQLPLAVAEISDPRRIALARDAYGGPLEVVAGDAIVARIIAQCVRHPGISDVYGQILTHAVGEEIHLRHFPELAGRHLRALHDAFPRAIPLGVVKPGGAGLRLNPPASYTLSTDDRIVFLATDHEACTPLRDLPPEAEAPATDALEPLPSAPMPARRRVLVLGFSEHVSALIAEFGRYDAESFDVDVASVVDVGSRESHLAHFELPAGKVNAVQIEADYTVPAELSRLDPARYDNVVIVGSRWTGAEEEADARTILAYLLLREILPAAGTRPAILAEVMDPENLALFERARCETLQPTLILAHMLSQVVLRRELGAVFEELFGPSGAEIVYRRARDYGLVGAPVRFADAQAAALAHGEIALGFHLDTSATPDSGARLNPPRDARWQLNDADDVVVLTTYHGE